MQGNLCTHLWIIQRWNNMCYTQCSGSPTMCPLTPPDINRRTRSLDLLSFSSGNPDYVLWKHTKAFLVRTDKLDRSNLHMFNNPVLVPFLSWEVVSSKNLDASSTQSLDLNNCMVVHIMYTANPQKCSTLDKWNWGDESDVKMTKTSTMYASIHACMLAYML